MCYTICIRKCGGICAMINKDINSRLSVTIPNEVMEIISKLADEYGISKSKVVANIVNSHLKSK